MDNDQDNVRRIFSEAADLRDEERAAFLKEACGADEQLRASVERLLKHDAEVGSFMDAPVVAPAPTIDQPIAEQPGTMIGPYKLVEEIGEGGMGSVFMALQKEPVRRKVALKVIKPGMDSKQVVSRFEAERQALAMMDHPNIARVFDGGATELGRPYFVMELVKGIPITDYCDRYRRTTNDRLGLFGDVCRAVQHAHQKGIIHRDLKPSNILVTLLDGRAIPKVIDFGIAKATSGHLTDETLVTAFSQMVGTPMYMSPEQVDLSAADVDTRSDVYSLGVLLYELLTGTTPFDRERIKEVSYDEFRRIIREEEPPRPSTRLSTLDAALDTVAEKHQTDPRRLSQQVSGELDWIVMKSLEKDRTRRYESANELAKDVQRYLDDEAVEACPPTAAYRLKKFARRNKAALITVSAVALALIVGAGIATWQAFVATEAENFAKEQQDLAEQRLLDVGEQRKIAEKSSELADKQRRLAKRQEDIAKKQRDLAEQQRDVADRNLYLAHMRLAQGDWDAGQIGRLHAMLDSHIPRPGCPDIRGWEWYYFLSQCHQDLLTLRGHGQRVCSVAFSPDNRRLASASWDGTVKIWDVATGQGVFTLHGKNGQVHSVAWSPDGKRLASGHGGGNLSVWDAATGQNTYTLANDDSNGINSVAWSPDGQLLASANGFCAVRIWDAVTGNEVAVLGGYGNRVAWRPDGKQLASGGQNGMVRIWDTATRSEVVAFDGHNARSLCWSPDGRRLASGNPASHKIWDTTTWEELPSWCPRGQGDAMAWSPDGRRFIVKSDIQSVRVWDVETGKELRTLRGHTGWIRTAAWSPNGQRLATAGSDRTVKLWDVSTRQKSLFPSAHAGVVWSVAWSPDGRHLASAGEDHTVKIWEAATGKEILRFDGHTGTVYSVAWSPDGKSLASASSDKTVKIWDAGTAEEIFTIARWVTFVAWDPSGQRLAGALERAWPNNVAYIWDRTTGDEIVPSRTFMMQNVAWSPDGQHLAIACDGPIQICDPASGKVVRRLTGDAPTRFRCAAWSADGRRLAACHSASTSIYIWDVASGKRIVCVKGHVRHVLSLAWSPDGRRLVSTGDDETIKIWDGVTGQEIVTLYEHPGIHRSVAWSPNGLRLASAGDDGTINIWDASPGYQFAASPEYRGQYRENLARRLAATGRHEEAIKLLEPLVAEFSDVPEYQQLLAQNLNNLAWYFATGPDARYWDGDRAATLARRAVQLSPETRNWRHTLGVAEYRAGNWKAALKRLDEASPMEGGRGSYDWFFRAMAHWQLAPNVFRRQKGR